VPDKINLNLKNKTGTWSDANPVFSSSLQADFLKFSSCQSTTLHFFRSYQKVFSYSPPYQGVGEVSNNPTSPESGGKCPLCLKILKSPEE